MKIGLKEKHITGQYVYDIIIIDLFKYNLNVHEKYKLNNIFNLQLFWIYIYIYKI